MKLYPQKAPHIRSDTSNKTVMGDVIITLAALYFMAACYYGRRVLELGLLSVAVCWGADALCVWRTSLPSLSPSRPLGGWATTFLTRRRRGWPSPSPAGPPKCSPTPSPTPPWTFGGR